MSDFWAIVFSSLAADWREWIEMKTILTGLIIFVGTLLYRLWAVGKTNAITYAKESVFSFGVAAIAVVIMIIGAAMLYYPARVYSDKVEELAKVSKSFEQLQAKLKTGFSGKINQTITGDYADSITKKGAFLFITLSITNTGEPSALEGWGLDIEPLGIVNKGPTALSDSVKLNVDIFGGRYSYTNADAIYEKTLAPVPQGGLIRGNLLYVFTDVSQHDLESNKKYITIRFQDVRGNQFKADYVSSQLKSFDSLN